MPATERCGFTYTGGAGTSHCCYRETWGESERCVWHAETTDDRSKPDDALSAVRAEPGVRQTNRKAGPAELLDGADLTEETLPAEIDLSGVSLSDADLSGAELPGADLSSCNLRDADVIDADLRHADLSEADCRDADLNDANLTGADLTDTILSTADCSDAVLRSATLCGADLEGAFLNRADLSDADLSGALLYGAIFSTARINDATVLDEYCPYDPIKQTTTITDRDGPDAYTKATSTYQELEDLCAENALLSAQSHYFVRRQDIHTRQHRDQGRFGRWVRARVSRGIVLYGESPFRVIGTAVAVIVLSTLLYPLGNLKNTATGELMTYSSVGEPISLAKTLLDSFYFSTLSFTTMTYGHYVPVGNGKILTMLETTSGVVLIALLVFVFGRRATR